MCLPPSSGLLASRTRAPQTTYLLLCCSRWFLCGSSSLLGCSSSISSSAGLEYSATMFFSSCSRSGFSMKRTVPSRPLSPIRPGRGVPFVGAAALGAVDVGVGGWIGVTTSFGETSFGDGLLPFDSRPLPFPMALPFRFQCDARAAPDFVKPSDIFASLLSEPNSWSKALGS